MSLRHQYADDAWSDCRRIVGADGLGLPFVDPIATRDEEFAQLIAAEASVRRLLWFQDDEGVNEVKATARQETTI